MIVKKKFSPKKVWHYIKWPVLFSVFWSILISFIYNYIGIKEISIPFIPVTLVGSALAIFIAFRNNSSYARWWEVRTLWAGILNASRLFGRLLIALTESHKTDLPPEEKKNYQKKIVNRIIAWVHCLRLSLRSQDSWSDLKPLLQEEEYNELLLKYNKNNYITYKIATGINEGFAKGFLAGFDGFQLEGQLTALVNHQGGCERIKHTPIPKQYDYFNRVFVNLLSLILPFGLLNSFGDKNQYSGILVVIFSVMISGVFIIMERTGAANEHPFENLSTDVPMSSICNTIERDLQEMLGEKELTTKMEPVDGYIY
jgi:putative membrane protein